MFEELKTSEYLLKNKSTTLSKIIFSLRSKTLDIKTWQPWKYYDNLCVFCELKEETIDHFLVCKTYDNLPQENRWEDVYGNCVERQFEIAKIVKVRIERRMKLIDIYEAGHTQTWLQGSREL